MPKSRTSTAPKKKPKPKEDRGEFRGIYCVLPHTPEFQALSAPAKLCWYTLKLELGRAGIAVCYVDQLPRLTGMKLGECETAAEELQDGRWLYIDGPIMWLRNGVRFDPFDPLGSPNGRKGIENYLRTLPRLPIVAQFAGYYKLENPLGDNGTVIPRETSSEGATQAPVKPLGRGFEAPSEKEAPSKPLPKHVARSSKHVAHSTDTHPPVPTVHPSREEPPAADPADDVGRSVGEMDIEDFVSLVIRLANRGMADAGIPYEPLLTTGKHRQPVFDWLQAGYSRDVIRTAVYHTAKGFKPDPDDPQISSMKYFGPAVKRVHETGQASKVEIPPDSVAGRITAQLPRDRNGKAVENGMYRPQGSMADRDTNGPTGIVATLNAVISKTATQLMDERVAEWEQEHPDDAEWLRQDLEEELDREISAAAESDDDPDEWPDVRKRLELKSRFLSRVREKIEAGDHA